MKWLGVRLRYIDDGEMSQKVLNVVDASLGGLGPVENIRIRFTNMFGFLQKDLPAEMARNSNASIFEDNCVHRKSCSCI